MTSRSWKRLLPNYFVLTLFLLIILIPIIGLVFSAFKTDSEVINGPLSLPSEIRIDAFKEAWTTGRFNYFFRNSVIVTIVVVVVSVILATLTGYAFAMLPVPGRKFLYPLMLLGYMVPFEAVIIPLYHMMNRMNLTDTYWALILPQVGLSVSFGTLWMSSFFRAAPRELVDAAAMDGCNRWQVLWRILWPLARPAVLTLVVLVFMWTWNEFLLALVMIQKETMRTLPVGLAFFQGRYSANIPLMAAGSLIVAAPILLVYILFQRYFIRGMLGGAVKE
ncbi:MAG TPA: carbohydrate ABC transporter permease [Anaerolineaceae bacterium]|nr:carbohydrate ABC transporter permease [Anaerolineaceae bacterium]